APQRALGGEVLGELADVATRNRRDVWLGSRLEAAEAVADVVAEGGLAHLAVVDAVDPTLDLHSHRFRDSSAGTCGQRLFVVGPSLALGGDHVPQVVRLRQRALVRDEDPVRTALHLLLPVQSAAHYITTIWPSLADGGVRVMINECPWASGARSFILAPHATCIQTKREDHHGK